MAKLTDQSIMTFGAHKGKKLIDTPGSYLLWIKHNIKPNSSNTDLHEYINDNLQVLLKESEK